MSFNEIYSILKKENIDRICFVETGSFFITIGSDAKSLADILELNKICFCHCIILNYYEKLKIVIIYK